MTEVFLHVGMDKTGTTSIQRYMMRNYSDVQGAVYYPQAHSLFNHELICSLVVSEQHIPVETINFFGGHEEAFSVCYDWFNGLVADWREHQFQKIVLSSEAFYSLPFYGVINLKKLFSFVEGVQIKVICSVDNPASRYRSQLIQRILDGRGLCPPHPQQVWQYINRYQRIFGKDNLAILDFAKSKASDDVIGQFLYAVGIERQTKSLVLRENSSMSAEALKVALTLDSGMSHYRRAEEVARLFLVDQLIDGFTPPKLQDHISEYVNAISDDYEKLAGTLEVQGYKSAFALERKKFGCECNSIEEIFVFDANRYAKVLHMFQEVPECW